MSQYLEFTEFLCCVTSMFLVCGLTMRRFMERKRKMENMGECCSAVRTAS